MFGEESNIPSFTTCHIAQANRQCSTEPNSPLIFPPRTLHRQPSIIFEQEERGFSSENSPLIINNFPPITDTTNIINLSDTDTSTPTKQPLFLPDSDDKIVQVRSIETIPTPKKKYCHYRRFQHSERISCLEICNPFPPSLTEEELHRAFTGGEPWLLHMGFNDIQYNWQGSDIEKNLANAMGFY